MNRCARRGWRSASARPERVADPNRVPWRMWRRPAVPQVCGEAEASRRIATMNRRVWVTARSRRSPAPVVKLARQLATEIAAPSRINGPQHAPSPNVAPSADGSRAAVAVGTSGFLWVRIAPCRKRAGEGWFPSLSGTIVGESATASRVPFGAPKTRALDPVADSPRETLRRKESEGKQERGHLES